MDAQELRPGLWRWTAPHPDWTPEEGGPEGWEPDVGCMYYEAPGTVVLIDPLAPPEESDDHERFWSALDRDVTDAGKPVAVLLTVYWHERSARAVAERYGASVWVPERGIRRLEQLRVTNPFQPGDPLPGGVLALPANRGGGEVLYWLAEHRALVPGDVLLGADDGGLRVCPDSWLPEDFRGEAFRTSLRYLLELPVERVLVSHGEPVLTDAREALARALGVPHSPPSAE